MPVDIEGGEISARHQAPAIIDRTTNTIVVPLADDEVLTLIKDLASAAWDGAAHLVIELDPLTYPKRDERDEETAIESAVHELADVAINWGGYSGEESELRAARRDRLEGELRRVVTMARAW